ncbi:MAG TPA: hypothetical protein VN278_01550 [Methanosarcina sp.]|nr:hypothetical protein [Methanosarcina sp.]
MIKVENKIKFLTSIVKDNKKAEIILSFPSLLSQIKVISTHYLHFSPLLALFSVPGPLQLSSISHFSQCLIAPDFFDLEPLFGLKARSGHFLESVFPRTSKPRLKHSPISSSIAV